MHCVRTAWVDKDLGQTSGLASTNLTPYTFTDVDDTRPDNEPPALITQTMLRGIEWEARNVVGVDGIPNKTTSCVRIETDHKEKCEVVSVPKGFEALVFDLLMGCGVH